MVTAYKIFLFLGKHAEIFKEYNECNLPQMVQKIRITVQIGGNVKTSGLVCENSLYYFGNFPVNMKLFQTKKLKTINIVLDCSFPR